MKLTKDIIIEKIKSKDYDWFYDLYNESYNSKEIEVIYEQNWGDGNDYQIVLLFKEFNWSILLDGTYSSWDSPSWNTVSFAKPYTFTETRYRESTLDEIRDDKINDVLDNKE